MRKGLSKIAREHSKDRMMVSNSIELFGMEEKKILRSSNKTKISWEKQRVNLEKNKRRTKHVFKAYRPQIHKTQANIMIYFI
jgi:hypothetical protein